MYLDLGMAGCLALSHCLDEILCTGHSYLILHRQYHTSNVFLMHWTDRFVTGLDIIAPGRGAASRTYYSPYVVSIEISKRSYIYEQREYIPMVDCEMYVVARWLC